MIVCLPSLSFTRNVLTSNFDPVESNRCKIITQCKSNLLCAIVIDVLWPGWLCGIIVNVLTSSYKVPDTFVPL